MNTTELQALTVKELQKFADDLGSSEFSGLRKQDLIKEKYKGIRPAPGYPACPDHSEKIKLFDLLNVKKEIDMKLTENFAMTPAASVSGWYFSHEKSKYFGVGTIGLDQIESIAKNRQEDIELIKKYLRPNLE